MTTLQVVPLFRGLGAPGRRRPAQYAVGEHWTTDRAVARSYGPIIRIRADWPVRPFEFVLSGDRPYYEELKRAFGSWKPEAITRRLAGDGHDGLVVRNVPVMRGRSCAGMPWK